MKHTPTRHVAVVLMVLLAAGAATARERGFAKEGLTDYAAPQLPSSQLSLAQAVALAIEHDPNIHQARERSHFQLGILHQSTGLFDTSLSFGVGYGYDISFLEDYQFKTEDNRRIAFESLADSLQIMADYVRYLLNNFGGLVYPICDEGLILVIDGKYICTPPEGQLDDNLWHNLANDLGLTGSAQEIIDNNREENHEIVELLDRLAAQFRSNLRALGQIPEYQDLITVDFDLGLTKMFRNGISIRPSITLEATQDRYRGKPTESSYGGNGIQDTVQSVVSLRLDVPLGKGRGKASTGAAERAAQLNLEASLETNSHAVASSALATSTAYWDVVASQERVELLARQIETTKEIYRIGQGLRDAGEIVESDLSQTRARLAQAQAQHVQARQQLLDARLALADAIGLQLAGANQAPIATDSWPDPPEPGDLDRIQGPELTDVALANRSDAAAARLGVESAAVIAKGSKRDLMVRTDLSATVSYRGRHEGGSIKDAKDLVTGWRSALFGYSPGPSAVVSLDFNWPFKNNVARGLYAQSLSLHHQAVITKVDLDRVIGVNVETLSATIRRAAMELREREASARYQDELVKSEIEKFKLGVSGVYDVIYTEQEQISQLLALVDARQNLAALLSRLRFETGTLVSTRIEDGQVVVEGVQPLGYSF